MDHHPEGARVQAASKAAPRRYQFKLGDTCALVALPLAYAGMIVDNMLMVGICLGVSGAIAIAPAVWHHEVRPALRIGWVGLIVLVFGGLFWIIKEGHEKKELALYSGVLISENLPDPTTTARCNIPDGALKIYLGRNAIAYTPTLPRVIIEIGGQQILTVDRAADGLVISNLYLFDDRGDTIVHFDSDGFRVSAGVRTERPDRHTLIVYDRTGVEVFNIQFLNPKAMYVRGIFRRSGSNATITDGGITMTPKNEGTMAASGSLCFTSYSAAVVRLN